MHHLWRTRSTSCPMFGQTQCSRHPKAICLKFPQVTCGHRMQRDWGCHGISWIHRATHASCSHAFLRLDPGSTACATTRHRCTVDSATKINLLKSELFLQCIKGHAQSLKLGPQASVESSAPQFRLPHLTRAMAELLPRSMHLHQN